MLQQLTKRSTPFGQEGVLLLLQKSTGGSTPFGQEGAGPRPLKQVTVKILMMMNIASNIV